MGEETGLGEMGQVPAEGGGQQSVNEVIAQAPQEAVRPQGRRVIFADFAVMKFAPIVEWLKKESIEADVINEPNRLLQMVSQTHYEVCIVNLLVGGNGPYDLIDNLRKSSANPEMKIFAVSRQVHKMAIQSTIQAGAHDFIAEPFENETLFQRIGYHMSPKQVYDVSTYEGAPLTEACYSLLSGLIDATESLSRTPRNQEYVTYLKVLQQIADMLGSNRCSLIVVEAESYTGMVLATSDDPNFHDFPISLHKYPEILHVMHTGAFVHIEDVSKNALASRVGDKVRTILVGSLLVIPVRYQGEILGVLTMRRPKSNEPIAADVLRVLQATANVMTAHSNIKGLIRRIYKEYSERVDEKAAS